MIKKLVALMLAALLVIGVPFVPVFGVSEFFSESFESYAEDAYPDTFRILYNGTGDANQKVMTMNGHDGSPTKVFRLQGAHYWSSEQLVSLPSPLPETLVLEAYVRPISATWPGGFVLYNPAGTWGTRVAGIFFESDGNIKAISNGDQGNLVTLQSYTMGQWYHVKMAHDLTARTYTIYIDGTLRAADIPMHPSLDATDVGLFAGNIGTNEIAFDDVVLRLASSAKLITGFSLSEETGAALIDNDLHTVTIEVAYGTDITALIPDIAVSPYATLQPASGVGQDFSSPVHYTVTADDGTTQDWTVTVTVAVPPSHGLIQFEYSSLGTYEGYSGFIPVQRVGGTDGEVSVSYNTVEGTALAGIHFTAYSGTLTWADGDGSSKYIPCTTLNDSEYHGYVDYAYVLHSPTGGAELGAANLPVQVSDNETPPVPTGLEVIEGDGYVQLRWNSVPGAYYYIYYRTTSGSLTHEESVYNGTSCTITGLTNGTPYYFAVQAGHNIYFSALSAEVSGTPMAADEDETIPDTGGASAVSLMYAMALWGSVIMLKRRNQGR